jgi:hypothetical protein
MNRPSRSLVSIVLSLVVLCSLALAARASDYEQDVKDCLALLAKKAGEVGMLNGERRKYEDALKKYGDERERMLTQMIGLLSYYNSSGIQDTWRDLCGKGKELVDKLQEAGPYKLKDIGLEDFVNGEKKIYELNQKGVIPWSVELMYKLEAADQVLVKKYQEDIAKVRDGDKVIEAQLDACQTNASKEVKALVKVMADKVVLDQIKSWGENKPWGPLVDWLAEQGKKLFEERLKDAKERHAIKAVILDDIKYVEEARDKLSAEWIEEVFKKGEEAAHDLPDAGEGDDYKAKDWERFAANALDDLKIVRERALEGSKAIFDELLPDFKEELKSKFACMMDDPSKLNSWYESIESDFKTMDELFAKGKELSDELSDGAYKKALVESLEEARNMLTTYTKLYFEKKKECEEEMNK